MGVTYVYLLECADGSFYVGITGDLELRLAQHQAGEGCGYTAQRLPVQLVWHQAFGDREQAAEVERQVKGWSRVKKMALIDGEVGCLADLSKKVDWKGYRQRRRPNRSPDQPR